FMATIAEAQKEQPKEPPKRKLKAPYVEFVEVRIYHGGKDFEFFKPAKRIGDRVRLPRGEGPGSEEEALIRVERFNRSTEDVTGNDHEQIHRRSRSLLGRALGVRNVVPKECSP